jgi:hypothetical protein
LSADLPFLLVRQFRRAPEWEGRPCEILVDLAELRFKLLELFQLLDHVG